MCGMIGFPNYCPHPSADRCCLLSYTWPLCPPALRVAAQSQGVKRRLLEAEPPNVRQQIVIEFRAEDHSQAASFYRALAEWLEPVTVVRITKVRQIDAET